MKPSPSPVLSALTVPNLLPQPTFLPRPSPPHPHPPPYPQTTTTPLRNKQPRKPLHILPTANTRREIRHRQTNPTILADTQAPTRPRQNRPRRRLAHDALRPARSQPLGAIFPRRRIYRVGTAAGNVGRRIRRRTVRGTTLGARTPRKDQVFEESLFFVRGEFAGGGAGGEVSGTEAGGG